MKRWRWLALALVAAMLTAACTTSSSGGGGGGEQAGGGSEAAGGGEEAAGGGGTGEGAQRIVVVTHGQSSDPFWSVVANGVNAAGEDLGIEVEYQAPSSATFDPVEMSRLIDAAVASQPDGLVVSIPDADALSNSISAAIEAGIPVISMNSGSDVYQDLGILVHVGQTEREAGVQAGQRMAEAGVTNALCVNQEVGNVALDLRCEGFTEGLGGTVEVVAVELSDPTGAQERIANTLAQAPDVNGLLTLGPTGSEPALAAIQAGNLQDRVQLATFDLSPTVLQAVADGEMLFAIDQQQYLQGYLPIIFMNEYIKTGALPGGNNPVLTGPGFVTQETAADVIELSEAGVR